MGGVQIRGHFPFPPLPVFLLLATQIEKPVSHTSSRGMYPIPVSIIKSSEYDSFFCSLWFALFPFLDHPFSPHKDTLFFPFKFVFSCFKKSHNEFITGADVPLFITWWRLLECHYSRPHFSPKLKKHPLFPKLKNQSVIRPQGDPKGM